MGPEDPTWLWPGATFCQQVGKCLLLGKLRSLCGAQRAKVGLWTCHCYLSLREHRLCRPRAVLDPTKGIVPDVPRGSLPSELGCSLPAPVSPAHRLYKCRQSPWEIVVSSAKEVFRSGLDGF